MSDACLADRSAKCCRVRKNREIVCVSVCARVHSVHVRVMYNMCFYIYTYMPAYMTCTCARVYVSKVEESDVR